MVFVKRIPHSFRVILRKNTKACRKNIPTGLRLEADVLKPRLRGRDRHLHDIGRLRSFGALHDIKFDVFALLQ